MLDVPTWAVLPEAGSTTAKGQPSLGWPLPPASKRIQFSEGSFSSMGFFILWDSEKTFPALYWSVSSWELKLLPSFLWPRSRLLGDGLWTERIWKRRCGRGAQRSRGSIFTVPRWTWGHTMRIWVHIPSGFCLCILTGWHWLILNPIESQPPRL